MRSRAEPRWDRTSAETRADLERARGRVITSLSSYRDAGETKHAAVWSAGDREQRFEADVGADHAAAVLAKHAREGFHPVLVGMAGPADRPSLAFVLERVPAGQTPPRFVPPRPFRDADGTFFGARAAGSGAQDAGFLGSIAAAGTPRDTRGTGLVVAGIWAPQPEVHVAWAVHLDALDASGTAWRDRWETRTLETIARPVMALPIIGDDGARWVLSLWHDRPLTPWPAPDPLAHARRFEIDEDLDPFTLPRAIDARRDHEDRRVIALGAGDGPRFFALYGAPGTEEPLARRFVITSPDDETETEADHPLDRWAFDHMRATGARHGQIAVVRRGRLAFHRAYTHAEEGYPVAHLDDAMRLGSISKALTTLALLRALGQRNIDTPVAELLGLRAGEGPPRLASITLRHLLAHTAGLRTFADLRPDQPNHPLSEHALTILLDGAAGPARPGQLAAGLRAMRDDAAFTRNPAGATIDYSNEGFVLLGELLSQLTEGRFDAYERAAQTTLLRPAGVDPGERGCLLGAGRKRARERRESPAHPSSPTWAVKRFAGDDLDEGPLSIVPYADNGPFLGGAAGWCVPPVSIARVLAALGPRRDGSGLWDPTQMETALAPVTPGSKYGHGVHLGEPGWWTFRARASPPSTLRVRRISHNGRIEGGAALLVLLLPWSAADLPADALDASLGVLVAFNQLGPLYDDPHGGQLLAILRRLEGSPGWDEQDFFERSS